MEILSLQELRRVLQKSDKKAFVFSTDEQTQIRPASPVSLEMICWFSEVWPQTNTVVMRSNGGELCFRGVQYVVRHDLADGEIVYTIHCKNRKGTDTPSVYELVAC